LSVAATPAARPPRIVRLLERWPGVSWLAAAAVFVFVGLAFGSVGPFGIAHATSGWFIRRTLYGVIALLVVAPVVFARRNTLVAKLLGDLVLSGLGLISYGIFLHNGPFVSWIGDHHVFGLGTGRPFLGVLLATLAVTIPVAALSYRLIERPFLRLKDVGLAPRAQRQSRAS
jgi:peptidoglycan/LPS O-acetylase OafA/YrhL